VDRHAEECACRQNKAIEGYGGRVVFCEPTVTARQETCGRVQRETGAHLVHPYDDDRIIAGQATAAKELLEEIGGLDAVFAPVSGGGLLSGTCLGAKGICADVRVFGCEPERADDAYRSLTSGTLQSLDSSDTIADGLRASLSPRTFAILRRHVDRILLVSEEEIISAARLVWERMKIIIEAIERRGHCPAAEAGRRDVAESAETPRRTRSEARRNLLRRERGPLFLAVEVTQVDSQPPSPPANPGSVPNPCTLCARK